MPYKPKKPCRHPNCPNLTHDTYCDVHKAKHNADYNNFKRTQESKAFYNSTRWRALSKHQLTIQPLCQECLKNNRFIKAQIADHIVPIKNGGEKYDIDNLQSLCLSCHNKKTSKEKL